MPILKAECPSGLTGTVRALKGKELKLLADRRKARSGDLFDELLAACWVETTSEGPYRLNARGMPEWLDVLAGDRFYTLIRMRLATYPTELYSFPVQCLSPACGEPFDWELDLAQLPVRKLTEESLEKFKQGVPFETTMAGKKVKFQLPTGRHERKGARFARGSNQDLVRVLAVRILEIDGVDPAQRIQWLEDQELPEHRDLLARFDEVDCGVDTEIEVQCPSCGGIQLIDLPFGQGFFLPKRTGRSKSRRS